MSEEDLTFRGILVGPQAVGKTQLMQAMCGYRQDLNYTSTIGCDVGIFRPRTGSTPVKFQVWDTAGQERFLTIVQQYMNQCAYALVVFDLARAQKQPCETMSECNIWLQEVKKRANNPYICLVLVGTKLDLVQDLEEELPEAVALAEDWNIPYMEVSGRTGAHVEELKTLLLTTVLTQMNAMPGPDYRRYGITSGSSGNIQLQPMPPYQILSSDHSDHAQIGINCGSCVLL